MHQDIIDERSYNALLEQSKGDYKAFLYDCDGTLADNMQAHKHTYVEVALEGGVKIDPGIIDEFAGYPIAAVIEQINKRYHSSFDPFEFEKAKSALFFQKFIAQTQPVTFVVNHLKAHAGKIKIGVVSGSARKTVVKTLEILGIDKLVEALVCGGETPRGKPHPDPFLLAAEILGVAPKNCLVFEDGDAGVRSAEAAGMKWIRIDKVLVSANEKASD
jgi:HAD superfamily hydrolase (TIGR01509 family)